MPTLTILSALSLALQPWLPKDPAYASEEWRELPGLPDYAVSSFGRVMRITKGRHTRPGHILTPTLTNAGLTVSLRAIPVRYRSTENPTQRKRVIQVARLVLVAFGDESPYAPIDSVVGYRDGDMTNIRFDNLYWRHAPIEHRIKAARGMKYKSRDEALALV